MDKWRVFPLSIAQQDVHIEQSEQLLSRVQPSDLPLLAWSMAEPMGLVLGFSQKRQTLSARAAHSLPIYQRRAGGTAVLVGPHLLSLDVVLPAGHPLMLSDIVESYRWFGETWVAALLQVGVQARTIPPAEAHAQRALLKHPTTRLYETLMSRACYGTLSPYEVAVGRRKVVGFDMIRRRGGSLLQAGVLLRWETALLAEALGHTEEEQALLREGLDARAVGLDVLLGRAVEAHEVIAAFEHALVARAQTHVSPNAIQS